MAFYTVQPKELESNLFRMVDDEWLLLCCYDKDHGRENMMTASWGGMGVLWNRQVCFLFVRPQRYTHDLLETQTRFSVCVLPEEYRCAHKVCGAQSGKTVNKIEATGLHEIDLDGVKALEEAKTVFVVRQLYRDNLTKGAFIEKNLLTHYPLDDFHTVYVCEIEKIFQRMI